MNDRDLVNIFWRFIHNHHIPWIIGACYVHDGDVIGIWKECDTNMGLVDGSPRTLFGWFCPTHMDMSWLHVMVPGHLTDFALLEYKSSS
jgi:hypothetical protein